MEEILFLHIFCKYLIRKIIKIPRQQEGAKTGFELGKPVAEFNWVKAGIPIADFNRSRQRL